MASTVSASRVADEGFEQRFIETPDGVRLAIYDRPALSADAPTIVLVNGLGGALIAWRHLIHHFGRDWRIVSWDYRGLYDSAFTEEQKRAKLPVDVPTHARDAIAVLDALKVDEAAFIGWSMGVQLNFELYRHIPDRMLALVQVAGSWGRSLSTTMFGKAGERVILPMMEILRLVVEKQGSLLQAALGSGMLIKAATTIGLAARSLDVELAKELSARFLSMDFSVYNRILGSLGDHDAEDVLATLSRPVLVIAGDRDPMTPHALSNGMVERIPDAEKLIVAGGSHYVPVEFPAQVNRAIADFLARRLGG